MEQFIVHGGLDNFPRYNCSAHTPEEWSAQDGEVHRLEGVLSIVFGIIVELLYIPCILVLSSKEFRVHSCFKIMLVLGIIDMGAISVNSIVTGILLYEGAVFCTYPTFIYISGSFVLSCWSSSCMTCLILIVNRLLDIAKPELGSAVFEGKRTYIVLAFPILYGMYFFFFTSTPLFSSKYHAWFCDPLIFKDTTYRYDNFSLYLNNIFVVGCTISLYAFFIMFLGKRLKFQLSGSSGSVKAHKQIFVQSLIICTSTLCASIMYVLLNVVEVPVWSIKVGHLMWQIDHSCPAFIYVFVNRTIRGAICERLGIKKFSSDKYSSSKRTARCDTTSKSNTRSNFES